LGAKPRIYKKKTVLKKEKRYEKLSDKYVQCLCE
jgi:hypothetical protein